MGCQVLHSVVPHTGAGRMVASLRERLREGLDDRVLAESQREDHRQHTEDGYLARGSGAVEMETVDTGLNVRVGTVRINRGVERTRDKVTPGEAQGEAIVMGDEDDDAPGGNIVGKGDGGGVGKGVTEAGQENRVAVCISSNEGTGDHYHLLAGDNQPLDSGGSIEEQSGLHMVRGTGAEELGSLGGRRWGKGIGMGESS